ncbi:substrate-binding domain-containing protein [Streptomyces sp. V4-01]|uniref:Substrate-binding domain-containing protein n=1 Tax=Actinacidiphila polyblastidii TaxID=3110430 RepID=A0ABU7PMR6_9ACTN|nr:substrate-binding domain-containing protein [Streptomyces sp. V4-01]
MRAQGFPFVVIDPRTTLPPDIASFSAAHLIAARGVTQHLVAPGHRRIGAIGGPQDWPTSQARVAGHAAAPVEVGVPHCPELPRSIDPNADWGYDTAHEPLDLPQRPTAPVAFHDRAAVGALRAAYERGCAYRGTRRSPASTTPIPAGPPFRG